VTQDLTSHQGAGTVPGAGNGATAARGGARAAVEAAERAFASWSGTPPAQRRGLLQRASELLMRRQSEIAALVTEETGSTLGWGGFDGQLAAGMLAYYAGQAGAAAEEEREIPSQIPGKRAKAVRQPTGVVVGIVPWNAPVILGVRAVAAPLAYGNTMVLKASEQCPRTHAAIVDALAGAGVPAGAINLVTNEPEDAAEVAEELIAHPAARRISFTGSTRAGHIIAQTAARHLKRVLLELGGKAPLVVLADADLERAVAAASFGSFMHQGQICMSTERHRGVINGS
jgi:vanillin dehydrogenase